MKILVNSARLLVGLLFIFSGLVKAIDPLGLSYKMQEFFEAWAAAGYLKGLLTALTNYALPFAIIMIALEVILGLALLIGWQKKNQYLAIIAVNPLLYFFNQLCFI